MRMSRVLIAGVAVAAAGIATSAFTASNTVLDTASPATARLVGHAVPPSPTSHYVQNGAGRTAARPVEFTVDHERRRPGQGRPHDPQERQPATSSAARHLHLQAAGAATHLMTCTLTAGTRNSTDFDSDRSDGGPVPRTRQSGGAARPVARPPEPGRVPGHECRHQSRQHQRPRRAGAGGVWLFWPDLAGRRDDVRHHARRRAWSRASRPVTSPSSARPTRTRSATWSPTTAEPRHRRHAPDRRRRRRPVRHPGRQQRLARPGPPDRGRDPRQAVRQVPQGGKVLDAVASPWSLALIVVAVLGVFGTDQRGPRAGGRHSAGRQPATAPPAASPGRACRRRCRRLLHADPRAGPPGRDRAGVVAVLAAVGGAVLLAMPSTETEAAHRAHGPGGPLHLRRHAGVGTTYPTGDDHRPATPSTRGSPTRLTVSFEHTVGAPGLDAARRHRAAGRSR